jgi:rRNA maturation endonuclease Nob1
VNDNGVYQYTCSACTLTVLGETPEYVCPECGEPYDGDCAPPYEDDGESPVCARTVTEAMRRSVGRS